MAVREKAADDTSSARWHGRDRRGRDQQAHGDRTRVTVLGHLQRGGSPCPFDRLLATRYGAAAVELVAQKKYGEMVSYQQPMITSVPLEKAISNLKLVDPEGELVKIAEGMGSVSEDDPVLSFCLCRLRQRACLRLSARAKCFCLRPGCRCRTCRVHAVMICALFLIRSLEQHEFELAARVFAYIAYFWMAGLFLFFCVSLFSTSLLSLPRRGWIKPFRCYRLPHSGENLLLLSIRSCPCCLRLRIF